MIAIKKPKASIKKSETHFWPTYFKNSKKKIQIIFCVEFYARNKSRVCYATLKRIAEECGCHINTVYGAIAYGIIRKIKAPTIFRLHPLTKKPLFNNHVLLEWLGDTQTTSGAEYFGAYSPSFRSGNGHEKGGENVGYIEYKESSYQKKEECSPSFESKTREELKSYPEPKVKEFLHTMRLRYQGKERFIPLDLPKHLERFKRENPLKKCSLCGEVNRDSGSMCNECFEHYKLREQNKQAEPVIGEVLRSLGINAKTKEQELIESLEIRIGESEGEIEKFKHKAKYDYHIAEDQIEQMVETRLRGVHDLKLKLYELRKRE